MGGGKFPPCVDSGLWMPFSQHREERGGERGRGKGGAAEKSSIASTGIRGQRDRRSGTCAQCRRRQRRWQQQQQQQRQQQQQVRAGDNSMPTGNGRRQEGSSSMHLGNSWKRASSSSCDKSSLWMPFSQHRKGRGREKRRGKDEAAEESSAGAGSIRGQRDHRSGTCAQCRRRKRQQRQLLVLAGNSSMPTGNGRKQAGGSSMPTG